MPTWKRHFSPGQLQFLTSSTYRRARLFECKRPAGAKGSAGAKGLAGAERSSALQQMSKTPAGAERSSALQRVFVEELAQLRSELGFLLIGWVLIPDHFHLLIKPEPAEMTSQFMQEFKKLTAQQILATLTENQQHAWCGRMLARLELPPSVHADSRFRVWQRRYYPFGIYSDKKRLEKLTNMHNNPVKQGLVTSPDQWPWSSFRFYYLNDSSVLRMDRLA